MMFLKLVSPLFHLISFIKGFLYRSKDRHFVGSTLPVTPGGEWRSAPQLPSYRYEFGGAVVGDKIFVVGGIYAPSVYNVTKKNECFDVATAKWELCADHPVVVHHPGATADGNKVYIIGGNGIRITSSSYAHSYNPETDSWQRLADMPTKRCALGLSHWGGKIYAVGGADNKSPLAILEEYDIQTNSWQRQADMPTAREHLFAVATGGKIYAIGGYQNDRFHNVDTFESYDVEKKVWETLPPVPARISGFSACVWGDSIFTFGGEQGWSISGEVYEYKIKENNWYRRTDMPSARYAGIVVAASDGIHVIGGNRYMMSSNFSKDHDVFIP